MLKNIDRVALAVHDADDAVHTFEQLFDAEVCSDSLDHDLGAQCITMQWGSNQIELLQPTGPGPVNDFIQSGRTGAFACGFSLDNPAALAEHLGLSGIKVHPQSDDRFIVHPEDLNGGGLILSKPQNHQRVGLSDKIWQITYAIPKLQEAVDFYTPLFKLEDKFTNFYSHNLFGYDAAITWFEAFDGGILDSVEYLEPNQPGYAVDKFVKRNQQGIYMISIETDDVDKIKERVESTGNGWTGNETMGFIHPKRMHGLLLGVVTYAYWNGKRPLPEQYT